MTISNSRKYHAHAGNYGNYRCRKSYIVIHYTGSKASAEAEARYAQNDRHDSSFHYVIDRKSPVIYQVLESYKCAWSVGAWKGARQIVTNDASINIEVCCAPGQEFTQNQLDCLQWLVTRLMDIYGIPAKNVIRHYDCHTGHKACPAAYVDSKKWSKLHDYVTSKRKVPYFKPGTFKVTASTLNVRSAADSTKDNVVGKFKKGAEVRISETKVNSYGNTWGKVGSGRYKGSWVAMRFSGTSYVKEV